MTQVYKRYHAGEYTESKSQASVHPTSGRQGERVSQARAGGRRLSGGAEVPGAQCSLQWWWRLERNRMEEDERGGEEFLWEALLPQLWAACRVLLILWPRSCLWLPFPPDVPVEPPLLSPSALTSHVAPGMSQPSSEILHLLSTKRKLSGPVEQEKLGCKHAAGVFVVKDRGEIQPHCRTAGPWCWAAALQGALKLKSRHTGWEPARTPGQPWSGPWSKGFPGQGSMT